MKKRLIIATLVLCTFGITGIGVAWLLRPGIGGLDLGFGSYLKSPAVVTDFSIEQPLGPITPSVVSGADDLDFPRSSFSNILTAPQDAGDDGVWIVSAGWVELLTDKAWRASVEVPIASLSHDEMAYQLLVIFGPNGQLVIGSDSGYTPDHRRDVAQVCGTRFPEADRNWRLEVDRLPEIPYALRYIKNRSAEITKEPTCPPLD